MADSDYVYDALRPPTAVMAQRQNPVVLEAIKNHNDGVCAIDKDGCPILCQHKDGFDAGKKTLVELTKAPNVKKLACAKWLIGHSSYTEAEKEELKKFFAYCDRHPETANLEPFMANYATEQQRDLFKQLH